MRIITSLEKLPVVEKRILAVGAFDGVHKGHVQLLSSMVELANEMGAESMILTFSNHPQEVLHPENDLLIINSVEKKIQQLTKLKIDTLVMIPFTKDFSEIEPDFFYREIVVNLFGATHIIAGPNHAVGKNRKGDHDTVEKIVKELGLNFIDIPEYLQDNIAVRSTKIRKFLNEGNIKEAEALLGYRLNELK